MARLAQYDYLFVIGTLFAFLDAWNIGANDVANSWATSVGSRSVSYLQAMVLAAIMEFTGAIGAGARVADTIRTKVVDPNLFAKEPAALMLGMLCAVIASAVALTFATKFGFPVSTTHSILGGVIGMGVAAVGAKKVSWIAKTKTGKLDITGGIVSVFLGWIVSPALAGAIAAVIFLFTKFVVLKRKNAAIVALASIPIYFAITASLLCMLIITKGGQIKSNLTSAGTAGVIIGVGACWGLLMTIFLLPWCYRRVIKDDWPLRWYHIPMGPLLLRRPQPPPPPHGQGAIRDFYEGRANQEELAARRNAAAAGRGDAELGMSTGSPAVSSNTEHEKYIAQNSSDALPPAAAAHEARHKPRAGLVGPKPAGSMFTPAVLFWHVKNALFRGVDQDVVTAQGNAGGIGGSNIDDIHARASHFDNKAEYIFSFLQVMTACTASFTHGANDVANAVGPYTTVFQIWHTGKLPSKPEVPLWILCFGGIAILVGLWTYGYHIMRNLGNKLTLQSPARGFSMELGSAVTIIIATKFGLPVSTTQCITGATVAVGLCNGDWKAINWRMVTWIYLGWLLTLPTAGIISGILMAIFINAPRFTPLTSK